MIREQRRRGHAREEHVHGGSGEGDDRVAPTAVAEVGRVHRREAPGDAPKPGLRPAPPKKKLPEKRKERDIYADGPKPPKVKREKGRAPGWLDELDDE